VQDVAAARDEDERLDPTERHVTLNFLALNTDPPGVVTLISPVVVNEDP
jgi:hypothetical protein